MDVTLKKSSLGKHRRKLNVVPAGKKRYFDPVFGKTAVKVTVGEHYVTDRPDEMIVTVLGSCVSACVRDTHLKMGGMNHFMLPNSDHSSRAIDGDSMRYGNNAMEVLINDILRAGGSRNRLEFKLFGGANLGDYSNLIGSKNARFAERYLADEQFMVDAKDLGQTYARRIRYFPYTGKVMMQALTRQTDISVFEAENEYQQEHVSDEVGGSIELFDD